MQGAASRQCPGSDEVGDAATGAEMWTVLYVFTVCFVALALFAAVDELQNRPLATALKFFLIAVAVAAIASAKRMLP